MRQARIATFAAGAAVVALTVTGCSPSDTAEDDGPVTVNLALGQDMETLLPGDSGIADNISVLDVVYDGLVRYDPETTEPYNYVAESIESDDNTVWTIKIKPDLTFQNGEPVDAAAFARSWNHTADGDNGLYSNYFFERFEGYEEMQPTTDDEGEITAPGEADELSGLKVVDDLTLEVTLTAPFAGFATMLGYTGFYPIAQECLDDIEACSVTPIGNGPFRITEWDQGVSLTAERWADYPLEETPEFDRIEWTEYSGGTSWADFEAGSLDVSYPPPADLAAAQDDPQLSERYVEIPGAALTYIAFPLYEDGPWQDIEFRKAISMAIDRESIVDELSGGLATPADSWVVPDGVPGGEAGTCEWCAFDPEAAQTALEEAGGWPEGETLSIGLTDDEVEAEYFKAIGDSIEATLGIPYELEPNPDFYTIRAEQGFDGIFRNNWFPDYPLNENYLAFYSTEAEGEGQFGWHNEAFEEALDAGDQAADLDEAVTHYQEAEQILAEDFPTIPFRFNIGAAYYSERLDNVVLDPFSAAVKLRLLSVSE